MNQKIYKVEKRRSNLMIFMQICQYEKYKIYNNRLSFNNLMQYLPLILLLAFVIPSHSLTSSPTTSPNPIYSDAGIFTFSTTPYYGTANSTLSPATFALTFTNRTQTTTNYHFGYAIQQINYQFANTNLNFSVWVPGPKTATSIQAQLYTNNANKINLLSIRYVTIEPVTGVYGFTYTWIAPKTTFSNGNYFDYVVTGLGPFNLASITIWNAYVGIDATLDANLQVDVYLYASAASTTSINFRVSTITPTPFYFTSAVVGAFLYNPNDLLALPNKLKFTVGSVKSTTSLTYTDTLNIVRSYNTIIGMVSHHIQSQSFFHQITTITPSASISASSNYSYFYYEFSYMILQFMTCTSPTAYLMLSTSTCYDACPPRYQANSYFECNSCLNYDCYYCLANGSCSQCSAVIDFRVIKNATMRCVPITGYYDDGVNSLALPCNSDNCLTCSSPTYCLSCSGSRYLAANNTCVNCISNCLSCSSASTCSSCITNFTFINGSCVVDCSKVAACATCSNASSSVICSSCNSGFNLTNNSCIASPNCTANFTLTNGSCVADCTVIASCATCSNASSSVICSSCNSGFNLTNNLCFSTSNTIQLTSVTINLIAVYKQADSNAVSLVYSLSASDHTAFSSLNWTSVVQQQSSLNLNFTSFSYNADKGQLTIGVTYGENLNQQNLNLSFTFPNTSLLNIQSPIKSSASLGQSNNLSLQYYSNDVYAIANTLSIIAMVMSISVMAFFIIGFYSGKLIMLEWVTVFQLTFLSLLTLENLSPTFASLRFLSYSCGYSLSLSSFQSLLNRRFTSLQFSLPFLNNYNLVLVFLVAPLFISIILAIINCLKYKSRNQFLTNHSQLLKGEAVFYALMFSAYTLFVTAGIEALNIGKIGGVTDMVMVGGLVLHYTLIASMLIYAVLLVKIPYLFGEFETKFTNNVFLVSYYCWVICERILVSTALLLIEFKYQSSAITAFIVVQLIFIGVKRPYGGDVQNPNLRSIMNLTISALIEVCFVVNALYSQSLGRYAFYIPYVILGLLAVTFLYNIYYFVKEMRCIKQKDNRDGNQIEDEWKLMQTERAKVNFLILQDQSLLSVSNISNIPPLNKDSLAKIKEQCLQVKGLQERHYEGLLEGEINFYNLQYLQQI